MSWCNRKKNSFIANSPAGSMIASIPFLLHSSGYFGYSKAAIVLFLAQCALYPIALACVGVLVYYFIKNKKGRLILVSGIAVVLLILSGIRFKSVSSACLFAHGYGYNLRLQDDKACTILKKVLSIDGNNKRALQELLKIYSDKNADSITIAGLNDALEKARDPQLFYTRAMLYKKTGCRRAALAEFKNAYAFKKEEKYLLGAVDMALQLDSLNAAKDLLAYWAADGHSVYDKEYRYYHLVVDMKQGDHAQALRSAQELQKSDFLDENDHLLLGKLYGEIGNADSAQYHYNLAIQCKLELPEAYYQLGLATYLKRNLSGAEGYFRKSFYFDNRNSRAYILNAACKNGIFCKSIPQKTDRIQSSIHLGADSVNLDTGEKKTVEIIVKKNGMPRKMTFGFTEPYGFGIQIELDTVIEREHEYNIRITISGKRPSKVNFGNAWTAHVIVFDKNNLEYGESDIRVTVLDRKDEEGRILFVITEDLEQTSGFPHKDPHIKQLHITAPELRKDLIDKVRFADDLARKYGIKWTHMLDIGSAFLRPRDLARPGNGKEWTDLFDTLRNSLNQSIANGNDVQLHIHGYSIPGNRLSRQLFDTAKNQVIFTGDKVRVKNSNGKNGAWAENFTYVGNNSDWNSRNGSICRGKIELERLFRTTNPSYSTIAFRAGEYEFGDPGDETKKSIIALKLNNILCGSDAYDGSLFNKSFQFFKRIGSNAYLSSSCDIRTRADSLLNVGILEILPVPQINARDYIMPIDDWHHVKMNYDLCFDKEKIRNDVFVIMEMYHLINTNNRYDCDKIKEGYEDWGRMERHFSEIREHCPKMECVTFSEAIQAYLDRYSPDIYTILQEDTIISKQISQYKIKVYAREIEVAEKRPHFVRLVLPRFDDRAIKEIDIVHAGIIIQTLLEKEIPMTFDLAITDKENYSLRIITTCN
jgi:hypothetical protein